MAAFAVARSGKSEENIKLEVYEIALLFTCGSVEVVLVDLVNDR
jgi:hypothetical protein